MRDEYQRRRQQVNPNLYAPWQPAEVFLGSQRKRDAVAMLRKANVFPIRAGRCLEIGFGELGWLADLVSWGIPEENLHGIELMPERAQLARKLLPRAHRRVGDATEVAWCDGFVKTGCGLYRL
jgi:hypothetical protein